MLSKFLEANSKAGFKSHAYLVTGIETKGSSKFGFKSIVTNIYKRTFKNQPQKYTQSEPIFIYDKDENFKLMLSDNTVRYTNGKIYDELNTTSELKFDVISKHANIRHIQNECRAVTRDNEGNYREFIIREIEDIFGDNGSVKEVYAEGGEYELIDDWLTSYVQASVNLPTALGAILQGTRFEVGEISNKYSVQPVELKHMSKRKAVNELIRQWDGEVRYRVETDGERVTRRYVDVLEPSKEPISKTYLSGRDIKSANRVADSIPIKTALYGVGAADENGNRLTFADVEWKVENGDPVDKPLGQAWVGDHEAMEKWGAQGGTKHKTGGYDGQEEDPAELLLNTWRALQEQLNIRNTYEVNVINLGEILGLDHDRVRLGNKVNVQVSEVHPPIESEASVVGYEHDLNDRKQSKVIIGQFRNESNTEERLNNLEKDWNEKRGELEKKPEKIKNELEEHIAEELAEANENIENAKKELEEAIENIEIGREDIEGLDEDLRDLDRAIRNRIPYGMAAEDINSGNTKILGKNLVIDGNTTVTGSIGASRATFFDMGTERMVAKNATIDQATITGVIDAPHARIRRASLENVTITGRLDGVDGRFIGTVLANQIEGSQIYGLTFDTGFSGGYRINMERQVLRFYEGGNVKMTIGFRDGNDNPLYEPFIRMGKGKSDGTSVFYVEKNEDDVRMSYRARSGYSYLKMVHGGNVDLTAIGNYAYLNASYKVVANTTFEAPTINQTSTVKAKQNIRKYEGDAIGIVMDTDVFNYYFKRDLEKGIYDNEQVGFLAESSPMLKTDDSISLNKAVAYNWRATQQQQDIIDRLTKRVDDLEAMMEVI